MPTPARKKSNTSISQFEKSIDKLEALVEKLESGDLPLEMALKHFEEGIALVQRCQKTLNDAEQKVQLLSEGLSSQDPHEK